MSTVEFGVKTGQGGYSFEDLRKVWSASEELDYDSVWLYDHFYALSNKTENCFEAWTTLSALAALTKRIKIGTMATCVSYRHPSLLAKMGATVDMISHGRLILGIGAGWYEDEYHAYGYEFPDASTRVRELKEALIVIDKLWTEDRSTFDGDFYSLRGAVCFPKPMQKPRPQILVGISSGKRTMPRLASRYADGLNTTNRSLEECRTILENAEKEWEKSGKRQGAQIKSWQGFVLIGDTPSEVDETIEKAAKAHNQSAAEYRKHMTERGIIIGRPDDIVERLRKFKEAGFNSFLLGFIGDTEIRPLEVFRDKVSPQLR
jgi:F420-dependent oxidoreductase-like protein